MAISRKFCLLMLCSTCVITGWFLGRIEPLHIKAQDAATKLVVPMPMPSRLAGNFYMQTSAEYRACCLQTYNSAKMRLDAILDQSRPKPAKPAIVMDLDETVVDNSAFQTYLYRNKLEYTDELWAMYEEKMWKDVRLVPGVQKFINYAESVGVTVIYLSNRNKKTEEWTIATLKNLGLNVDRIGERLFLKSEVSSEKATRRELVASRYNVLMYFGDNLRDFSEAFAAKKLAKDARTEDIAAEIKRRANSADDAANHWGIDWFVLPNCAYGEWDRISGPDPVAVMHPLLADQPASK